MLPTPLDSDVIEIDATSSNHSGSITVPAGTELLVFCSIRSARTVTVNSSGWTPTAGALEAATLAGTVGFANGSLMDVLYVLAPTAGTGTLNAQLSAGATGLIYWYAWDDCAAGTKISTYTETEAGTGSTATLSIGAATADDYVLGFVGCKPTRTITGDGAQSNETAASYSTVGSGAAAYKAGSGSGATLTWTFDTAPTNWNTAGVIILGIAGGAGQTITPGFIVSTAAVYAPTVAPGAVQVQPPTIASTAAVHQPTLALGAVTLAPSFIASTTVVYQPTITEGAPGETTLAPSFIASGAAVFAPTLTPGAVTVGPSFIASAAQVFDPSLIASAVVIAPHAIASGAVVFAPSVVGGAVTLLPAFIVSTAAVYAPTIADGGAEAYEATARTLAFWRTSGASVAHWPATSRSIPYWQATASSEG